MDRFSSNWLPAMRKPFGKKKKERIYMRKKCKSHSTELMHQHGRHFIECVFEIFARIPAGWRNWLGSQRGIRACHVRERLLGNSRAEQEWGKLKLSVLENHTEQIVAGHERHWTSESRFDTFQRTSRDSRLSCLPPARWLFRLAEPSALRRCEPALLPWKLKIANFTGKMASLREASKTGLTYVYAG